jgi:hypothetical protein
VLLVPLAGAAARRQVRVERGDAEGAQRVAVRRARVRRQRVAPRPEELRVHRQALAQEPPADLAAEDSHQQHAAQHPEGQADDVLLVVEKAARDTKGVSHTATQKWRIVTLRSRHGATEKWPLNEGNALNFRVVRVHVSTGDNHGEGIGGCRETAA